MPRLTQTRLADLANVSVELVTRLEQGRKADARLASFEKIADALGVPVAELFKPPGDTSLSASFDAPAARTADALGQARRKKIR